MEKSIVRDLKVGQIVMYKTSPDLMTSYSHTSYGVVTEVSDKTFIRWFDTERNTPYAFNTIHRLLREGSLEVVSC